MQQQIASKKMCFDTVLWFLSIGHITLLVPSDSLPAYLNTTSSTTTKIIPVTWFHATSLYMNMINILMVFTLCPKIFSMETE